MIYLTYKIEEDVLIFVGKEPCADILGLDEQDGDEYTTVIGIFYLFSFFVYINIQLICIVLASLFSVLLIGVGVYLYLRKKRIKKLEDNY